MLREPLDPSREAWPRELLSPQRVVRWLSSRQPFTTYEGTEGALPGEASERARRDKGTLRHAIGELLCCPYCTTTWAAAGLFGTYLADHKLGRTLGTFLTTISLAEMVQSVYYNALSDE